MKMMLHCGGREISEEDLRQVQTPVPTETYTPLPHHQLLEAVREQINGSGMVISNETLAVSSASAGSWGDRFFGLLEIESQYDSYAMTLGIRNSHDKIIPAGLCVGSRVFVCDNLAFSAEVVIARRHTRFIERDLPGLISRTVGRLGDLRDQQHTRIEAYQNTNLSDAAFHDLIIRACDSQVIAASKIPKVLNEYRQPRHDAFLPRTLWSAFNAFTEILKEYDLQDLPRRTQGLHGLCDLRCGLGDQTITSMN